MSNILPSFYSFVLIMEVPTLVFCRGVNKATNKQIDVTYVSAYCVIFVSFFVFVHYTGIAIKTRKPLSQFDDVNCEYYNKPIVLSKSQAHSSEGGTANPSSTSAYTPGFL